MPESDEILWQHLERAIHGEMLNREERDRVVALLTEIAINSTMRMRQDWKWKPPPISLEGLCIGEPYHEPDFDGACFQAAEEICEWLYIPTSRRFRSESVQYYLNLGQEAAIRQIRWKAYEKSHYRCIDDIRQSPEGKNWPSVYKSIIRCCEISKGRIVLDVQNRVHLRNQSDENWFVRYSDWTHDELQKLVGEWAYLLGQNPQREEFAVRLLEEVNLCAEFEDGTQRRKSILLPTLIQLMVDFEKKGVSSPEQPDIVIERQGNDGSPNSGEIGQAPIFPQYSEIADLIPFLRYGAERCLEMSLGRLQDLWAKHWSETMSDRERDVIANVVIDYAEARLARNYGREEFPSPTNLLRHRLEIIDSVAAEGAFGRLENRAEHLVGIFQNCYERKAESHGIIWRKPKPGRPARNTTPANLAT